jgi:hypothetical protein
MGLKNFFKGNQEGTRCVTDENGIQQCTRTQVVNDSITSKGTTVSIGLDSKTCTAFIVGDNNVLDEDKAWVEELMKAKEKACQRGLA